MTNHDRQRVRELSLERQALARKLKEHLDRRAEKVKDVPDAELDAAVEEAIQRISATRICSGAAVTNKTLQKGDRDAKQRPPQSQ